LNTEPVSHEAGFFLPGFPPGTPPAGNFYRAPRLRPDSDGAEPDGLEPDCPGPRDSMFFQGKISIGVPGKTERPCKSRPPRPAGGVTACGRTSEPPPLE